VAALTAGILAAGTSAWSPQALAQPQSNFAALAKQQTPAVVAILSRQQVERQAVPGTSFGDMMRQFYGEPQQLEQLSLGSGFVIDNKGDIVTANHVIAHGSDIHVKFSDGTTEPAKIVGADPETDIAVLNVKPHEGMVVTRWGVSKSIEPGDWVVAIGSPFGLGGTVTVGVLSARSRNPMTGQIGGLLQTDASINKGNSGGPLFDEAGEVIGVNTAIVSPSGGNIGIGFAVPSDTAHRVADELIANGKVARGYIGAQIQDVTDKIAEALGMKKATGALVDSVTKGGPADDAGIKPGDVITSVGSEPIDGSQDLVRTIANSKPGDTADIKLARAGDEKSVSVKLGQRPSPKDETATSSTKGQESNPTPDKLGIEVTPYDGSGANGPDVPGLIVAAVAPDGAAAEGGIKPGDLITSANGKPIRNATDLRDAWRSAQSSHKPVLLRVFRDGNYGFVTAG
jgi:serine protease Do